MELPNLVPTGAALVPEAGGIEMCSKPPRGKSEPTGPFNWPSGYQKMAPCTMNTLFWAGSVFAPNMCLLRDTAGKSVSEPEALNIQHFLQNAYIEAYGQLIDALVGCEALVGVEVRLFDD